MAGWLEASLTHTHHLNQETSQMVEIGFHGKVKRKKKIIILTSKKQNKNTLTIEYLPFLVLRCSGNGYKDPSHLCAISESSSFYSTKRWTQSMEAVKNERVPVTDRKNCVLPPNQPVSSNRLVCLCVCCHAIVYLCGSVYLTLSTLIHNVLFLKYDLNQGC